MTKIHITGSGGVIDNEVIIISYVLRSLGYDVIVQNPDTGETGEDSDKFYEVIRRMEELNKGEYRQTITITTTHVPWGG